MGFGVSVVIAELAYGLLQKGLNIQVGCMEFDDHFSDRCQILKLAPEADAIDAFIMEHDIDVVIAHTTPYFEVLPHLQSDVETWAWEHGDPTPSLFPLDQAERETIIRNKQMLVYPNIDRVIAISEFIRQDINWPGADIIYNGADHLPVQPPRKNPANRLRIGTLMRMGEGERFYKGGDLFAQLAASLTKQQNLSFSIMGRGNQEDADYYRRQGIEVHLNASDEERSEYLENLDVFLSLSLWEGFNLPLVEAQVSGKLGIALDTGAHPEVTPFVTTHTSEIRELLLTLNQDRALLYTYSTRAQAHCLDKFRWQNSVNRLLQLLA